MSMNNSIMSFGGIINEEGVSNEFRHPKILNTVYSGPVSGGKLVQSAVAASLAK